MLRITISKNGDAAVKYFDQALSKDDYFFAEKEVSGHWRGKAAKRLKLLGKVDRETFIRVVNNQHPKTGERLTVRNVSNRRAGYDYTFNAPKSVSLIYSVTKDKAILEAHQSAVEMAMHEIEEDMQTQVGQGKNKRYETTGNIAYAAFDHFTTRPVEKKSENKKQYVPDPHLHTHCFVPNSTWNEKKERFQAIEEGNIRRLAPYYEALYHSHLSRNLKESGYQIQRTYDRWEIKGVKRKTMEKFSNRTLEIEKIAKEKNITDAKEKSKLGAKTRLKKNKSVEEKDLETIWKNRLSSYELNDIKTAKGGAGEKKKKEKTISSKQAIDRSLSHFMERKSAIPKKRILGQAMAFSYGQLSPNEVKRELNKRDHIIYAERNTVEYLTTKEAVRAEDKMIEFASSTKGTLPSLNASYEIEQKFLNSGQRNAVQHALNSNDRVMIISGGAGVGKTSLLSEVKSGIEMKGKRLLAFAPSADASRDVLVKKGFKDSDTIAALLQNQKLQQQTKDNVILVDEAGMVGTQTMNQIFQIAEKNNARIILSGDYKQHNSVEAGDALRILEEKSGLQVSRVNEVVRQKGNSQYKQAIKAMSEGETSKGFQKLEEMNAIIEIEETEERQEKIAADYVQSIQSGRTGIVVSPTHFEGKAITENIRKKMKSDGLIEKKGRKFTIQRNLSFTESQKQDYVLYEEGMTIQFHQNVTGFKAGQKYEVISNSSDGNVNVKRIGDKQNLVLPLSKHKQFQVFKKEETEMTQGDLIRITANGKTHEQSKINNGAAYRIMGFSKDGHIHLSNGKTLDKNYRNFTHGYVRTSHSSQGKDAQDVFIAQSSASFPASNDKQFYVSASRGKERVFVYTDDKVALKEAISKSADRITAGEIAKQNKERVLQENRLRYYQIQIKRQFKDERKVTKQPEIKVPDRREDFTR